jgi:hypothetical protein
MTMRRQGRQGAGMRASATILSGDWPVSRMNAPGYSAHWAYIDTLDATEQWVNVQTSPSINFGGKVGVSPHAINDAPIAKRLWLDVWIFNPDGTDLVHKVTDKTVTPGGEIYLEVIANGSQIGQYSCHATIDIEV